MRPHGIDIEEVAKELAPNGFPWMHAALDEVDYQSRRERALHMFLPFMPTTSRVKGLRLGSPIDILVISHYNANITTITCYGWSVNSFAIKITG